MLALDCLLYLYLEIAENVGQLFFLHFLREKSEEIIDKLHKTILTLWHIPT